MIASLLIETSGVNLETVFFFDRKIDHNKSSKLFYEIMNDCSSFLCLFVRLNILFFYYKKCYYRVSYTLIDKEEKRMYSIYAFILEY